MACPASISEVACQDPGPDHNTAGPGERGGVQAVRERAICVSLTLHPS
jgi:hypothetical protein